MADWHRLFQINLHFPWLVQTALRALQSKRTHPRVVFIADELNEPWLGAYALSKTAQMHLMRAYARESRPERHPTDPIVTAVTVSTLDTEARRYYFPRAATIGSIRSRTAQGRCAPRAQCRRRTCTRQHPQL